MTWTCEQTEDRLSDHLDNLLGANERNELAAHLASCARCTTLVARVNGALEMMQRLEEIEAPAELVPRIIERTVGPRKPQKARFGWLDWVRQPRLVLGAATVLATFGIVFQSLTARPGRASLSSLSPVHLYKHVDRHAHLAYARASKFVNDLRVVYEIQSRLQTAPANQPAQEPASPNQSTPEKKSPGQVNRAIPANSLPSLAAWLPVIPERTAR